MPHTIHPDSEIVTVLREASGAEPVAQVLARHGVPLRTYQHWVRKFGKLDGATIRRLRESEARIEELERSLRALERDLELLRDAMGKPWRRWRPGEPPSNGPFEAPE
jgi:hypothetical protein